MIKGLGNDLVHIPTLAGVYQRQGEPFIRRILHSEEYVLWQAKAQSMEFLAGRFALKESAFKAFPADFPKSWQDVWMIEAGKVKISQRWQGMMKTPMAIHASISHQGDYAMAHLLIEDLRIS